MTWFVMLQGMVGCGGGEPTRSYCEAVCDWAVSCQETERTVDAEAMSAECLAQSRAADPSCEKAESGKIDPATRKVLEGCVGAVDDAAAAGECDAFVGSVDEIKTGTAPGECVGMGADAVATFEAARDATTETGAQLCQRFTDTFCKRTEECIIGDLGSDIPQAAIDALGGTPYELCVQRLDPVFTTECTGTDLYVQEASVDDVNAPRQAARECLSQFASIDCPAVLAGELPEFCAGSFTTTEQATAFGTALFELAGDFAEYAR